MGIPMFIADAFTSRAFAGNPAGVCILSAFRDAEWMLSVAREVKSSATAFVVPREGQFDLRWFTLEVEGSLCGHGTLAASHVLWEQGYAIRGRDIQFSTKSGTLTARLSEDWIELDFPSQPAQPCPAPPGLEAALGTRPLQTERGEADLLVLLDGERAVRDVRPNFVRLHEVEARAIIVTAAATTPGYDFASRVFAPRLGVDEDPATGSTMCCLAPFWQSRLHKSQLMALQVSARGGAMRARVAGDRVVIGGQAVTVLKGELAV